MDFTFSEEQQLLRDGVDRFVREQYDFETRRRLAASDLGYSAENWQHFADMGWLAMTLPEQWGGLDAGPAERMIVMEGLGRGLVLEPYLASVVIGAELVRRLGSTDQKNVYLPAVAEGRHKLALAYVEKDAGYDLSHITMAAAQIGDGYRLTGRKQVVLGGADTDTYMVLARTSGDAGSTSGLSLFLVPAGKERVTRTAYPTTDGGRAADLVFDDVDVSSTDLLGAPGGAYEPVDAVLDTAIAATLSEAVGAMDALNRLTGQHLKTRTQFGQPIGMFQVLQHTMADMLIAAEEARSMMIYACLNQSAEDRATIVSSAKVKVSEAARFVARKAVQLHGGMGVSDEMSVGHYFKRIFMIENLFGDSRYHVARINAQRAP